MAIGYCKKFCITATAECQALQEARPFACAEAVERYLHTKIWAGFHLANAIPEAEFRTR